MKFRVQYVLVLLFAVNCFGRMGGGPQDPAPTKETAHLSIGLSEAQSQYKIDRPILITITMTNNGKTDFTWLSDRPDPAYRNFWFSLRTPQDVDVPMSAYHRKIKGKQLPQDPVQAATGSSMFATLSPGQSVQFVVDLNKIYEIDKPGTYRLIVGRDDELNKISVRSKSLQVTLVP